MGVGVTRYPVMSTYFDDEKLNKILAEEAGKGPQLWSHYRTRYCGYARDRKSNKKFTEAMMKYALKIPHRIVIVRPYNVSEEPTVEILHG